MDRSVHAEREFLVDVVRHEGPRRDLPVELAPLHRNGLDLGGGTGREKEKEGRGEERDLHGYGRVLHSRFDPGSEGRLRGAAQRGGAPSCVLMSGEVSWASGARCYRWRGQQRRSLERRIRSPSFGFRECGECGAGRGVCLCG